MGGCNASLFLLWMGSSSTQFQFQLHFRGGSLQRWTLCSACFFCVIVCVAKEWANGFEIDYFFVYECIEQQEFQVEVIVPLLNIITWCSIIKINTFKFLLYTTWNYKFRCFHIWTIAFNERSSFVCNMILYTSVSLNALKSVFSLERMIAFYVCTQLIV